MQPRVRVAACLVAGDRMLLVAHRKTGLRHWLLPGGGVEMGETLVQACARELREETGVPAAIGRLLIVCETIAPEGRHLVNLVFAARPRWPARGSGSEAPPATPQDPAIQAARWVTRAELRDLPLHPPISEALDAAWDAGFGGDVQVLGNLWIPDA